MVSKEKEYNHFRLEIGALATNLFYETQSQRKKAFNRIRNIIHRDLAGIDLFEKEGKRDFEKIESLTDSQLLKLLNMKLPDLSEEKRSYVENLIFLLESHREKEKKFKKQMKEYVECEPIIVRWLSQVRGISTINSANLLQYFGYCGKAKHMSSLWKFAGLTPGAKKKTGEKADFNVKLRTLLYNVGECFVKCNNKRYKKIYDETKEGYLKRHKEGKCKRCNEKGLQNKPGHSDMMAKRYMVKIFLQDFYNACHLVRGKQPDLPYEAKLHPEWYYRVVCLFVPYYEDIPLARTYGYYPYWVKL